MDLLEPLRSLLGFLQGKGKPGPIVSRFEEELGEFLDLPHLYCLSHARICLYFALKSYDFEKDDEVLMTPINLPDMVNMIRILGLKEKFVDIKAENYSIDLEDAKKKLSSKTKFLFVTHLNGIIPNMELIKKFADENNLILIQDCTQNFGAKYKGEPLENFSELAFFALCDLKVLHTHMGGALSSTSKEKLEEVKALAKKELKPLQFSYLKKFLIEDTIACLILNRFLFNFFIFPVLKFLTFSIGNKNIQNLTSGKGIEFGSVVLLKGLFGGGGDVLTKEVPKKMLYHFSELQAKIGLKRLKNLDRVEKGRIENSHLLRSLLKIPLKYRGDHGEYAHVYWRYPIIMEEWEELQKFLMKRGIDSARSNLPCLSELKYLEDSEVTPVASRLSKNSVYLPLHYYLEKEEVYEIARLVNEYFEVRDDR